jgi:hypothetical protein
MNPGIVSLPTRLSRRAVGRNTAYAYCFYGLWTSTAQCVRSGSGHNGCQRGHINFCVIEWLVVAD